MSTIQRRDALHIDLTDRITRWREDHALAERLGSGSGAVRVEEVDEDGWHIVRAELPGVDPDIDIDVELCDGTLCITGQRSQQSNASTDGVVRTEFHYGRFERRLPLPAGISLEEIEATYSDGVLEVRMPVDAGEAKATRIPVQRSSGS